jgi:very-short-patch-repair endonuclease
MSVPPVILGGMDDAGIPGSGRLAGIVTAAELLASGMPRSRLRSLVRSGALVHVSRGVYARAKPLARLAREPAGEHAIQAAARLLTLPGTVASHHTAACIHGIDLLGKLPGGVAVTRPPGAAGSRSARAGVIVHNAALPADQVTAWRGILVTSVARTVVDLARAYPFRAGVVVADSALRTGQTSERELRSVLAACRSWPGVQRARQAVGFADARAESVLESISRVAFRDQRLPDPELQVWVGDGGNVIGRADFLWRQHRTIGEADGAVKYANPLRAMAQLRRDAELRAAGFEVVHFTWEEVTNVPARVAAAIRAAFGRAGRSR